MNTYEETKTFGSYDCVHDQIHYWKQEDLTDLEAKAMPEMNRYGVFALDTESHDGFLPEILSVQPLGGRQRIFHLHDLLKSVEDNLTPKQRFFGEDGKKGVLGHLQWLLDAIKSEQFLKLGHGNVKDKIELMGFGMWLGKLPATNVLDVKDLYDYNCDSDIYCPELLQALRHQKGLGKFAQLHNVYDHCIYDKETFTKQTVGGDWSRFDPQRKIFKGEDRPWMLRWRPTNHFLHPKQKLYLYLNLATPLRMLCHSVWWSLQEAEIPVSKKTDLFDAIDLLARLVWHGDYVLRSRNNRKIKEAKKYFEAEQKKRDEERRAERKERQKRSMGAGEEKEKEAELKEAFQGYKGPQPVGMATASTSEPTSAQEADVSVEEVEDIEDVDAANVADEAQQVKVLFGDEDEGAVYQGEKLFGVYYHPVTKKMGYADRGWFNEQDYFEAMDQPEPTNEPEEKRMKVDTEPTGAVATGAMATEGEARDLSVLYSEEELKAIEEAQSKRKLIQLRPHILDAILANVSIHGRYVDPVKGQMARVDGDPGHQHFQRNSNKRRTKLKNSIIQVLSTRTVPEHLLEDSLFLAAHCSDCGGKFHSPDTIQCPIARYHNGMKVVDEHNTAGFFVLFPCLVCDSVIHTTVVCPELHAFCKVCHVRGHRPGQPCRFQAAFKARFDRFSRYGLRTYRATSEGDRWGYRPVDDDDSVKAGYLSDTEDEKDFTKFILSRLE